MMYDKNIDGGQNNEICGVCVLRINIPVLWLLVNSIRIDIH